MLECGEDGPATIELVADSKGSRVSWRISTLRSCETHLLTPPRLTLLAAGSPAAFLGARFRFAFSGVATALSAASVVASLIVSFVGASSDILPLSTVETRAKERLRQIERKLGSVASLSTTFLSRAVYRTAGSTSVSYSERSNDVRARGLIIRYFPDSMLAALKLLRAPPSRAFSTASTAFKESKLPKLVKAVDTRPARVLTFKTKSGLSSFKTFLPVTPSLRQLRQPIVEHLHKGDPHRPLTIGKRASGGRNNTGRITVRARGGGHKRRLRIVDFVRKEQGEQEVMTIEYDPGRSSHIALVRHKETGGLSYIIAPKDLRQGDTVQSFRSGIPDSFTVAPEISSSPYSSLAPPDLSDPASPQSVLPPPSDIIDTSALPPLPAPVAAPTIDLGILRSVAIKPGNCLPIRLIPVGTLIHAITLSPTGPAILARSAGASARIIGASTAQGNFAQVKLNSGEVRLVHLECFASIGIVSNPDHQHRDLGKAGRMRWLGFRPLSRGMAQNATDHPHGVSLLSLSLSALFADDRTNREEEVNLKEIEFPSMCGVIWPREEGRERRRASRVTSLSSRRDREDRRSEEVDNLYRSHPAFYHDLSSRFFPAIRSGEN